MPDISKVNYLQIVLWQKLSQKEICKGEDTDIQLIIKKEFHSVYSSSKNDLWGPI
jgi:hypothetical protein